jgi:hypothetical protein
LANVKILRYQPVDIGIIGLVSLLRIKFAGMISLVMNAIIEPAGINGLVLKTIV